MSCSTKKKFSAKPKENKVKPATRKNKQQKHIKKPEITPQFPAI